MTYERSTDEVLRRSSCPLNIAFAETQAEAGTRGFSQRQLIHNITFRGSYDQENLVPVTREGGRESSAVIQ